MKEIFKKHRKNIIIGAAIVAVLAAAFIWGGNYPKNSNSASAAAAGMVSAPSSSTAVSPSPAVPSPSAPKAAEAPESPPEAPTDSASPSAKPDSGSKTAKDGSGSSPGVASGNTDYSKSEGMAINSDTGKDQYQTDPVPEGKPVPVEPQNASITDKVETCTLSVRCDTILNNMDLLSKDKWELVPKDGVIYATATVSFHEGESVFNVFQREMKKAKIQMEFKNTPMYNSAYIEGINNLYEFDVGDLSGWMYKVNGWFPNYGCSRYQLHDGDIVEWVYTCDLGKDVGGHYSVGAGS